MILWKDQHIPRLSKRKEGQRGKKGGGRKKWGKKRKKWTKQGGKGMHRAQLYNAKHGDQVWEDSKPICSEIKINNL